MSVFLPFLAVVVAGAFTAYHRYRLTTWVAIAAVLLLACWLGGANHVAVGVAAVLTLLVTLPLLLPDFRKQRITTPCSASTRRSCRR